jgi:membrane protease YdiL (CAAX protease family)
VATPQGGTAGVDAVGIVLVLLVPSLLVGMSEEVAVRGFVFQAGGRTLGGWGAIALTAAWFMFLHLLNPGDKTAVVFANLLIVSVLLAFVTLGDRGLWLAIGIHTGWNWCQGNIFGITVSGLAKDNSLFVLGPTDSSAILTGGDYGLEGSIAATVVLGLAAAAAFLWMRPRLGHVELRPVEPPEQVDDGNTPAVGA